MFERSFYAGICVWRCGRGNVCLTVYHYLLTAVVLPRPAIRSAWAAAEEETWPASPVGGAVVDAEICV